MALIGDHPAVALLDEHLTACHPSLEFVNLGNLKDLFQGLLAAPPALRGDSKIKRIVLLCLEDSLLRYVRILAHQVRFEGSVIVPALHDLEWPTLAFENPRPIIEYVYPGAGTNRFKPCFGHLLGQMEWHNLYFNSYVTNAHLIVSSRRWRTAA